MSDQPVGKITGKTSTQQFDFLLEPGSEVKKWDYIAVLHSEVGMVLAQVHEIERKGTEAFAHCEVVGYRSERDFLRKPRTPLEPKSGVYMAKDDFLKEVLGLKEDGLYLGLLEGKAHMKAFLEPKNMITKHLAVLAKSGAGKSYAVGVLLEELASLGVPIVIFDPHGEYSSIKYPNKHPDDEQYFKMYGISAQGFKNMTREFAINTDVNPDAEPLKLATPDNPAALLESVPFKLTNTQKGLLYNAVDSLRTTKLKFSFKDLLDELEVSENPAKWNLITGLQNLNNTNLFSFTPTKPLDLVKSRQLTIVNLKGAPVDLQQMAVQALASALFEARKINAVPPFFMVVEEAHTFVPERGYGEALSSKVIRTIASEGRKFGLGLCVISQRPARVEKNVLSQCSSQIALQVTNPNDLKAISNSFEGITSETEAEIRNLPIGKALVIGAADHPVFVDVRVRKSQHGGRAQTFDFARPLKADAKRVPIKVGTYVDPQANPSEMVYAFPPRIMPKDLVMMEQEDIKRTSLVLRPCLSVRTDVKHLVFDMNSFGVYSFTDRLAFSQIPEFLSSLSPAQRKVVFASSRTPNATIAELFAATGMGFTEVASIANSLIKQGVMTSSDGKHASLRAEYQNAINLQGFSATPQYIDIPAKKLGASLSEAQIEAFLRQMGVQVASKQVCYIPFYQVELINGRIKTVDALSYSLEF